MAFGDTMIPDNETRLLAVAARMEHLGLISTGVIALL